MKFSIIIPSFNSEKYIEACLNSIFDLNYPKKDYEVILVDGGSKDKTLNIAKKYQLKIVHSKNLSISNSRNMGAKNANGDILVFIDSDCIIVKNHLKIIEKNLKKYGCCGSFYKSVKNASWVAKTLLLIESKKKGLVSWLPGCSIALEKDTFNQINGFNENLKTGEDFDFCYRLRKKSYDVYNDPKIAQIHLGQSNNLNEFINKEMWRGNSLIKGIKEHGLSFSEIFSASITFYHLGVLFLFFVSLFITIELVIFSLWALFLPSFLLSLRKIILTGKVNYFFQFLTLIWIYQIARAISIIRYNQFKDLI